MNLNQKLAWMQDNITMDTYTQEVRALISKLTARNDYEMDEIYEIFMSSPVTPLLDFYLGAEGEFVIRDNTEQEIRERILRFSDIMEGDTGHIGEYARIAIVSHVSYGAALFDNLTTYESTSPLRRSVASEHFVREINHAIKCSFADIGIPKQLVEIGYIPTFEGTKYYNDGEGGLIEVGDSSSTQYSLGILNIERGGTAEAEKLRDFILNADMFYPDLIGQIVLMLASIMNGDNSSEFAMDDNYIAEIKNLAGLN